METKSIVGLLALTLVVVAGCRKDAAKAPVLKPEASPTRVQGSANPPSASDVVVRIRKLGGADGKQVMNRIAVATPVNDEFTVTEQVGAKQLELRGKVLDLKDGNYRVSYEYSETSATGRQQLKSLIEMKPNTEQEIGKLLGAGAGADGGDAMETFVLSLSRP